MRNGGRILLAVLNLYVRIKIRLATFDTNHSVTESTQTIIRCFNPEASGFCSQVKSADLAIDGVDVSVETIKLSISLRLAVDFLRVRVMCIKEERRCLTLYLSYCGQVGVP